MPNILNKQSLLSLRSGGWRDRIREETVPCGCCIKGGAHRHFYKSQGTGIGRVRPYFADCLVYRDRDIYGVPAERFRTQNIFGYYGKTAVHFGSRRCI